MENAGKSIFSPGLRRPVEKRKCFKSKNEVQIYDPHQTEIGVLQTCKNCTKGKYKITIFHASFEWKSPQRLIECTKNRIYSIFFKLQFTAGEK